MPLKTVAECKIQRLEILAPDGSVDTALEPKIPNERLLDIYRKMMELRIFDDKAFKLQRQGRLGTYLQVLGEEATQIVPPLCLNPNDWLIPTYRGEGAYYARGMKLHRTLLYWGGDDRGASFPAGNHDLLFSIPVATHLTHAAGIAWAAKLRKDPSVVLAYLGDGASSKGDFHEGLTFAGQFKAPVIYLIDNNQWAISVPRSSQSASETLAQKAWGYGAFGLQVDGNDVLAIYRAMTEAVDRARSGGGPTVLECETYRIGDHSTADDATHYRSTDAVGPWKKKDPVLRFRKYLESKKLWDDAKEAALVKEAEAFVQSEINIYEKIPPLNPLDMFNNNYATATWPLIEQRKELEELLKIKQTRKEVPELPPVEGRFP